MLNSICYLFFFIIFLEFTKNFWAKNCFYNFFFECVALTFKALCAGSLWVWKEHFFCLIASDRHTCIFKSTQKTFWNGCMRHHHQRYGEWEFLWIQKDPQCTELHRLVWELLLCRAIIGKQFRCIQNYTHIDSGIVGCYVGQSSKQNITLRVLLQSSSMLLLSLFKQSLRALAWQTLIPQS